MGGIGYMDLKQQRVKVHASDGVEMEFMGRIDLLDSEADAVAPDGAIRASATAMTLHVEEPGEVVDEDGPHELPVGDYLLTPLGLFKIGSPEL